MRHCLLKCVNNLSKTPGNNIFTVLKIKIVASLDTKSSSLEKSWFFFGVYEINLLV